MLWPNIVKAALIGSRKQPPIPLPQGTPPGDLLTQINQIDPQDREGWLLRAASALALYHRAGWLPPLQTQPLSALCDLDDLPCCSARTARYLITIIEPNHPEALRQRWHSGVYSMQNLHRCLHEWLDTAQEAGVRMPLPYLPILLNYASQRSYLHESVQPVLGKRGRWLAAQNLDWFVLSGEPLDESVWCTGDRVKRQNVLRQVRQQDPARGREMLLKTWQKENVFDAAMLLLQLAQGLSMDDEPWLESLLDDRRVDDRNNAWIASAALVLLQDLPESRLMQRMIAYGCTWITFVSGNEPRMEVALPDECDATLQRDGITPTGEDNRQQQLDSRGAVLSQVIRRIPPGFWLDRWNTTPTKLLAAASYSPWHDALVRGWSEAAQYYRDVDWIEPLLHHFDTLPHRLDDAHFLVPLWYLPPERHEPFLLHLLEAHPEPLDSQHPGLWLLLDTKKADTTTPARWSARLSQVVLERIRTCITHQPEQQDRKLRDAIMDFAFRMHPSLAHEAESGWPTENEGWHYWELAVNSMIAGLHFRRKMLKSFALE